MIMICPVIPEPKDFLSEYGGGELSKPLQLVLADDFAAAASLAKRY